ncbi:ATP synthase F1 subunit delta [candidate division TM6 bacterium RIFCSPHIGHO2_12_FULL_38_8]|nr:MAG: ATP synthase F1 subunit delta [candidate division TM6 bacterium RIFCSPHIGHO2_12_FULL_38_8]
MLFESYIDMRYSQSLIAKQYAKAYFQEFGKQLTLDDVEHIKVVLNFFRRHHNFMSLVSLLLEPNKSSNVVIEELFEHFSLPIRLKKLIGILILHKRLIIFAQVLQDICCLYFLANNILEVTITSVEPLENHEREQFENFFKKLSGKSIKSNLIVDRSLIAGVRMQSDLFLWQYCITQRLQNLSQKMLIEG